jgi:hypothetical protein
MRPLCTGLALLLCWPASAQASGEAGADIIARTFRVRLSTGMRVIPDDSAVEEGPCPRVGYFEREERELLARLGPLVPRITSAVAKLSPRALDLTHGAPRLTVGRSHTEGLVVTLEVNGASRAALDQLAQRIRGWVDRVPTPESVADDKGCYGPAPVPATVVLTSMHRRVLPGLRVRVGTLATAIDAHDADWLDRQLTTYEDHLVEVFTAALRPRGEALGLPAEWPMALPAGAAALVDGDPAHDKRDSALYVTYAGTDPNVSFVVPLATPPAEALSTELFKQLYAEVAGPADR